MKLSMPELKTLIKNYVKSDKIANPTFSVTNDNIVGLVDKIGKIITLDNTFADKLSMFDGEDLPFGKTIEEFYQDLILPQDYDPSGANALAPADPTYRPCSYSFTLGRKILKTTLRGDNVERAVNNEAQFIEVVAQQSKRLNDSFLVFKYGMKKQILEVLIEKVNAAMSGGAFTNTNPYEEGTYVSESGGTAKGIIVKKYTASAASSWADAIAKGFIVPLDLQQSIAVPTDTATGEAWIKAIKNDVESAQFIHEGHSLNGNTLGTDEGLVLLVKKGVMPSVDVDVMAGAFNQQKVAIPAQVVVVDDFGSDTTGVYAMLMDTRGMRLHSTYARLRETENGDGDFSNLVRHTENTAYISRNTFVKVYKGA